MKKFLVTASNMQESEMLDSQEKAEQWVSENLPYGIQKCRTGDYVILEGIECKCGQFVEDLTTCEKCSK